MSGRESAEWMQPNGLLNHSVVSIRLIFLLLACQPVCAEAEVAPARKFLADYCVKCHGPEKQKGDVRLDELTGDFAHERERWAVVLEQIRDGEMPPTKASWCKNSPPPSACGRFSSTTSSAATSVETNPSPTPTRLVQLGAAAERAVNKFTLTTP